MSLATVEVVTFSQIAKILGVSYITLHRWINKEHLDIPYRRLGGGSKPRYQFIKSEVEEWLMNRKTKFVDPRSSKLRRAS